MSAKPGRRTDYSDKFPGVARELCLGGCTDVELSKAFDVAVSTLYDWKLAHPEFAEAIKQGKAHADDRVEESLFARATGYSHPDMHIGVWQGAAVVTPITKHYPPDSTAMIFWLKNRRPKDWRDKTEQTLEAGDTLTKVLEKISDGGHSGKPS